MEAILIEVVEKRCEDYGADYQKMCHKIARGAMKWPVTTAITKSNDPGADFLLTKEGGKKPVLANAILMLRISPAWEDVLAFNELTLFTLEAKVCPVG